MKPMNTASLALGALLLCAGGAFAQAGAPSDQPRAVDLFSRDLGYEYLAQPDRYGTVTDPFRNELGLHLLVETFRNVCFGLERGDALEAALPPGYSAYGQNAYYFADEDAEEIGNIVLSPTGDIDVDEENGHPTFWLRPGTLGMNCRIEWTFEADLPDATQDAMAFYLEEWLPLAFALVPADRHELATGRPLYAFAEWDRYCLGRWCPMTVNIRLGTATVILETTLNITGFEGTAP